MKARYEESRKSSDALGDCLMALFGSRDDNDGVDARVGAIVLGQAVNAVLNHLKA
jgi:hypothetical protein